MKLSNLPLGTIDWTRIAPAVLPGASGSVSQRVYETGDTRLRLVQYARGYLADHWCHKGHVIHVLSGGLDIRIRGRHQDAPDGRCHLACGRRDRRIRVRCADGATVFVVD